MRTVILLCGAALQAAAAVHVEMPYRTVDGMELKLDLAVPDDGPGPHPVIVCLHGGGWSMGSKGSFRKYLPQFAAKGYAAAAIQYALAPARPFPAPIADTYAAVAYLRANAKRWNLDPTRVSLLGTSAGAHLVLLAGFDNKANVEAIIDVSGPADLRDWHMLPPAEKGLAALGTNSATLLSQFLAGANPADASPVLQVRSGAPPVLLFHWKDDQAVEAAQAQRLLAALEKASIKHEAVWFEGRGHALSGKGVEEIVPRTVAFLNALKK
ncbi:MAG TPA: alpha/beta hydrolase [Bryobacteraceae bacterium]|nr:alpha/beta hydrolase [Bryobacteraceae bacterium]